MVQEKIEMIAGWTDGTGENLEKIKIIADWRTVQEKIYIFLPKNG